MPSGSQSSPSTVGSEDWIQVIGFAEQVLVLAEPSRWPHNEHFEEKCLRGTQEESEVIPLTACPTQPPVAQSLNFLEHSLSNGLNRDACHPGRRPHHVTHFPKEVWLCFWKHRNWKHKG